MIAFIYVLEVVEMAQILVRNLDEKLVEGLKRRAKMNGRSLQAEVKLILEQSTKVDMETALKIANKIRAGFKGRKFTDSTELIREDRDR
jgi:antitoxin FitA